MRLFIAVNFPADVREAVHDEVGGLRHPNDGIAWIVAPLLHVTIKFIGEIPADRLEPLASIVRKVAAVQGVLSVRVGGVGAFPNFRRPRVVWVGVKDGGELVRMATRLDEECVALGIEAERRPFRPHLTVGRVKRELSPAAAAALAQAARGLTRQRESIVRSLDLMRSELSSTGPRYHVVTSVPLGER